MSNNTTLVNLGSTVREFFSGITRECVGQFCSAKRDYAVSCVQNIPAYIQESHSHMLSVLFTANVLSLAILNYTLFSPIERWIEANTAGSERLLTRKQWLNLFGVGAIFYAFNVGLTKLHKYQLRQDLLLLIATTTVVCRLLRMTIPQTTQSNGELTTETPVIKALIAERAVVLAERHAQQTEASVPDATQDPLARALQARTALPGLREVEEESKNNDEIRAVALAYNEIEEQLLLVDLATRAHNNRLLLRRNPLPEHTQERQIRLYTSLRDVEQGLDQLQQLRTNLQQAETALIQIREAAGQEQDGSVPPNSILGRADAAIAARKAADQIITDNQVALEEYDRRLRSAQEAREAATQARSTATIARQAADALLPPV